MAGAYLDFQRLYRLHQRSAIFAIRYSPPPPGIGKLISAQLSAGGIVDVRADDNSRSAVFDAMRRKESFGSCGGQ